MSNPRPDCSVANRLGQVYTKEIMTTENLSACLEHLGEAERLLDDAEDLASLARLALVIDMLRRAHHLPDREPHYELA